MTSQAQNDRPREWDARAGIQPRTCAFCRRVVVRESRPCLDFHRFPATLQSRREFAHLTRYREPGTPMVLRSKLVCGRASRSIVERRHWLYGKRCKQSAKVAWLVSG